MHDKIEMNIGEWEGHVSGQEAIAGIIDRLGSGAPTRHRGRTRPNHGSLGGWLFVSKNSNASTRSITLPIRSKELKRVGAESIPAPLISGAAKFLASNTAHAANSPNLSCSLDLSLNLTRFLRHRPSRTNSAETLLQRPEPLRTFQDEISLDGNDNWIPLSGRLHSVLRGVNVRDHFDHYMGAIVRAVNSEFQRATIPCNPLQLAEISFSVRTVETYWEWLTPDPVALVQNLWPSLISFARLTSAQPYTNAREGRVFNSLQIHADTNPGVRLKIYSKTNRRVRFEVRHTLKGKNRFAFPQRQDSPRLSNRSEFESPGALYLHMRRLREHAREVVNGLLDHHSRSTQKIPHSYSGFQGLLRVFFSIPDDYECAMAIAQALVYHQRFVLTDDAPENVRAALASLRKNGIVRLNSTRRIYQVAGPYRDAFLALRGSNIDLREGWTRVRTRRSATVPGSS